MEFFKQWNFILSRVSALFLLSISAFAHEEKFFLEYQEITNCQPSRDSEPLSVIQLFSSLVCPCMDSLRSGKKQILLISFWDPSQKASFPMWLCFPNSQDSCFSCKGCSLWRIICQLKDARVSQGKYHCSDIRWVILEKDFFYNLLNFLNRGGIEGFVPIEKTESCVLTLSSSEDKEEYLDVSWALLCNQDTQDLSFNLENGSIFEDIRIEKMFPFSEKSRQFRKPHCN